MAAAGVASVLVANEVVGADKITSRRSLAGHADLAIAVDDPGNIADLSAAMTAAGSTLGVLVDLDVGHGPLRRPVAGAGAGAGPPGPRRAGPGPARRPGLRGTLHAGAGPGYPDPARDRGHELRGVGQGPAACRRPALAVLSGGGHRHLRHHRPNPAVTELQAGSYVFMDAFHGNLVPGFEVSLTVLTSVMARHGDTVIFDAGRKSIGIDFVSPPIQGYGYEARYYAEEHALFDTDPRLHRRARRPRPAGLRLRADDRQPARRHLRRAGRPGRRRLAGVPARTRSTAVSPRLRRW